MWNKFDLNALNAPFAMAIVTRQQSGIPPQADACRAQSIGD
jgi:hypothetical protein